jgi:O-antigen/teichoic acid export membrane protein
LPGKDLSNVSVTPARSSYQFALRGADGDQASPAMSPVSQPLKRRILSASAWTMGGYGTALVLRLLGNLVIARLLSPEVFGIMAVATSIQLVIALTGDIGLRQAVIRSPSIQNPRFLNTAWTVQILRGLTIWIFCVVAASGLYALDRAGAIAANSVYGNRTLPPLIAVISFAIVIDSFQSMKVMAMGRTLSLGRLTIIELIQMVIGLCVAIGLAWSTHSIWSFVASSLVGSIITTSIGHLWLPGHRDRIGWDRHAFNELMHFGKWASISSFVGVIASNGNRLLLGAWLTPTSLGQYSIASNLSSVIDGVGGRLFGAVSLPALSEIVHEQPHRLREVFYRMRRGADSAYVLSAGFLFASGDAIVGLLYDPRYAPAGQMLQLLSFYLLFARYGLVQDLYIALGKASYLTAINTTKLISLFVIVPIFFYLFGPTGAILGVVLHLAPTIPLIFWLNRSHALNDFKFEALMLGLWPVGWLVGSVAAYVISLLR